jgi:hypothetical protein
LSGNQNSCSFSILVTAPNVTIAAFSPNTICNNQSSMALPTASPLGGIYTGSGVNGSNFDPSITGTGTHLVTYNYTDSSGCTNTDSSTITIITCNSINPIKNEISVKVYPNPNRGTLVLDLGTSIDEVFVKIYNGLGSVIYSKKINESKVNINLTNISPGVYFIKIQSNKGQIVKRIIVNND